jgi:hypothetical protein
LGGLLLAQGEGDRNKDTVSLLKCSYGKNSLYLHVELKLLSVKKGCRMIQVENSESDRSEGEIQRGEDVFCMRWRRESLICYCDVQSTKVMIN